MAFAGGVFTRLFSWVNEAQSGNPISPGKFDQDMNDMAAGLSLAILRDGTGLPTKDISWNGKKLTNLAVPVSPGDAMSLGSTPSSEVTMALGFTPVQQGNGIGQSGNAVKIGWAGTNGLKATIDTTDLGQIWTDQTAGRSLASSGYQKLPSGLIVQWGSSPLNTDSNGAGTLSFITAFPNAAAKVLAVNGNYASGALFFCNLPNPNKVGFGVQAWDAQNNTPKKNATLQVDWFALGY